MRISEICNRHVVQCSPDTSALDLSRLMRAQHVGDVVVVEASGEHARPLGLVTDRDLVVQVLAAGVDPQSVTAGDLMCAKLVTVTESEAVYDAIWHMRSKGVRRLPVVNARNEVVGIVAADDLTRFVAEEMSALARISPHQIQIEQQHRRSA
ncbi:MAG TPA: CBS domain-containing protein [Burkholderiaceae bacterium]|nr:CBS domain-containing protein [Burkholderiaceae bacterium]